MLALGRSHESPVERCIWDSLWSAKLMVRFWKASRECSGVFWLYGDLPLMSTSSVRETKREVA